MVTSYPFISETIDDININPVITTLTTTATVYELGIDPTDILAGVPTTIEITDPKFSTSTGWKGVVWSGKLAGTSLGKLGITMTTSTTNDGLKFTFSCAFPMAGDLVITGTQYNADCSIKEVVTFTLKVVMPAFDVKIGLLDGSKTPTTTISSPPASVSSSTSPRRILVPTAITISRPTRRGPWQPKRSL